MSDRRPHHAPSAYLHQAVAVARHRWRSRSWEDHGAFDTDRGLTGKAYWSACYAPSSSLYFDQFGGVRACCQNTGHLLGRVGEQPLEEIWAGARAAELRSALRRGDLGVGCDFCAWQAEETGRAGFARHFDGFVVDGDPPRWPRQLEFSLSNTCNLQCVMCDGDFSSAIRSQREQRPPLPKAYGEAFFDEIVPFLAHLEAAKFVGGEPFLGAESLRLMALLEAHAPQVVVTVTTNATIWNGRVEGVLDRLAVNVVVSLDGASASTFEAIRVGASFDAVLANLDRFRAAVRPRGGVVSITHCLMRSNWHEFDDLLRLAEARSLRVMVNTVTFPMEQSLYQLPSDDLAEVVRELERRTPAVERSVTGSRLALWHQQFGALRERASATERPVVLGRRDEDDR